MIAENPWAVRPDGRVGGALRECLSAAVAAPSIHNTQPWLFRPFRGGIDVYIDRDRRLDVLDPQGREAFISVGAALLNLRVAILARGRTPVVRLLADPAFPAPPAVSGRGRATLVARVRLGPAVRPSDTVRLLAGAIHRRHTIRAPFSDDHIPDEVREDLRDAAAVEGARLTFVETQARAEVLELVRWAERRVRLDPGYWEELGAWTHASPQRHDGVPLRSFGPIPLGRAPAVPIRDFGIVTPVSRRAVATFEREPVIAVLHSRADRPDEWLRTGEALERTLLTACVRGLASTLMTQPVEVPSLRAMLDDAENGMRAQAIIRFGYGPAGAPTPRRPVEDVLVV